jgi:glycosyltransferase involved in cell wall biosynthesis
MIVKNESKIIERCLNSAKPIIDYVSICDTGSTDQTPEIIENWCSRNNIPAKVYHKPFKNFGYNRSLAVSLAQKTFSDVDYLLLLDADMVLIVHPDFDKSSLDKDQYLTMQYDEKLKFWLTRLIKADLPWQSVGVTHEYWDIDRSKLGGDCVRYFGTVGKLDSLVVEDKADGGSRADKFQSDKQLLLEGIQDPLTPGYLRIRYMFYLAQTYMFLGENQESIKWYKKRVDAGGWVEEVFYSLLQIGLCYEQLANISFYKRNEMQNNNSRLDQEEIGELINQEEGFFAQSLLYFQKAWEYRPTRAEPLYQLARMHRMKSNHYLGLMYALQGKEIPFPSDDILFIDYPIYDYLFDYEISICAYYVKDKKEIGRAAQRNLESIIDQLPEGIAESIVNNARFY